MTTNPYAPPHAAVADLADDGGSSKLVLVVSVNAGLFGTAALLGGVFSAISRNAQDAPFTGNLIIALLGMLIVATAMGLFRHRLWAAILWCGLSGLVVAIPLLVVSMKSRVDFVLAGFLAAQFVGSVFGLWEIASERTIKREKPTLDTPQV
jgi:hypothetical protein